MGWLFGRIVAIALATLLVFASFLAADIWTYGQRSAPGGADAALVLGAAVVGDRPSPVYEERLRHAAGLYAQGRVRRILLTGGRSPEDDLSEAEAGRSWLLAQGIPAEALLSEDRSRTTMENIDNALPILETQGFRRVFVVSDPLHLRRAVLIARQRGLDALPSPTLTSRYRSFWPQAQFLLAEVYFTARFLLLRA